MNLKKIMKCADKLFIINTTVFHQKIMVTFDFMPTLNFKHYWLLCQYDNIYVGDDIKCKSIELFLYYLYIVVVCKYISGAFSEQELLTRQSDKETWINE